MIGTTARLLTMLSLGLATSAQANISSTFTSGLDGWTGAGGAVSWNAGGFLQQQDNLNTWMSVSAPAAYHGDLSAYLDGTLSFDGRNLNGVAANLGSAPWFGRVVISGPGGTATRFVAGTGPGQPLNDGAWHSYSAPLVAAAWSGNLTGALANVSSLTVTLEFNDDIVEVAGFDNFRVSAVPEPSAALLAAAGLAVVGWRARCRQARAAVVR